MPSRRRRDPDSDSDYRPSKSDNSDEEVEEGTTSKPCRVTHELPRTSVEGRKEKKREKVEVVDRNTAIGLWADSLKGPHLDLMVSLKQLAEVRLRSTGDRSLASCLTPASLRTIGIILEELVKDRMIREYPPADKGLEKLNGDGQL